jgi:hypothetical protein
LTPRFEAKNEKTVEYGSGQGPGGTLWDLLERKTEVKKIRATALNGKNHGIGGKQ